MFIKLKVTNAFKITNIRKMKGFLMEKWKNEILFDGGVTKQQCRIFQLLTETHFNDLNFHLGNKSMSSFEESNDHLFYIPYSRHY